MVKKGLTLTQKHKDNISLSMKEYYRTHYGPWKGITRNEDFKNTVSKTLRRTYANGHINWNKGLCWSQEIRDRIRKSCLNSKIGMGPKPQPHH